MRAAPIFHITKRVFLIFALLFFYAVPALHTQEVETASQESSQSYNKEELAQMLAPIALYPDTVLSQVLMASTYPIEVIEADRWVKKNPDLKDEALDEALLEKDWDASVKALCHFPALLAMMSTKIAETANIGNAFLAQESEVMDTIQELRAKARAQGNLVTTSEQKVVVEKETIIIEPAVPDVIYVPYYDPWYVYGPWWYPAYPPYYWGPPGITLGFGISYWPGFYFGFGYTSWSYFDWHRHSIYINVNKRPRYVRHDRWRGVPGSWYHNPKHRRGVAYRDKPTARKYGQYQSYRREFRNDSRGFPASRDWDRSGTRRTGERTMTGREPQGTGRSDFDRARTGSAQRESDRQISPPTRRNLQENTRIDTGRQQTRELAPERRSQPGIQPNRQRTQSFQRDLQGRTITQPDRQQTQAFERNRQIQQQADRNQMIREQRQRAGDTNVFNRVDEGRQERESSTRGYSSRQGRGNTSPGSSRSGGDYGGGRDYRGGGGYHGGDGSRGGGSRGGGESHGGGRR